MGFDITHSVVALKLCSNNVQMAVQMLLTINDSMDVPLINTVKYVFFLCIFFIN